MSRFSMKVAKKNTFGLFLRYFLGKSLRFPYDLKIFVNCKETFDFFIINKNLVMTFQGPKAGSTQDFYVTYMTRETGRTSNQLFEYVFWALKAASDKKFFKSFYSFPEPFDKALMERFDYDKKVDFNHKPVHYPFHIKYYAEHRSFIRETLFSLPNTSNFANSANSATRGEDVEQECCCSDSCNNILVLHLRLDDIDSANCYTTLTLGFYEKLLSGIDLTKFDKIHIVGNPINAAQEKFVDDVSLLIDRGVIFKKGSISEDFKIIMSATTLVASCSTFWFWPMFVGTSIKEIYFPNTEFINSIVDKDIYESIGIKTKIVSF